MIKSTINKINAHILVVDDDDRLRELLQKFLTDNGFSVDTAHDSLIARTKIRVIQYDIIILDVMMPGESGLSFLQYLRTISKTPILMLSAIKETKERIKGLEIGADDYLGKPFEPKELLLRIEAILRRTDERYIKSSINSNITKFGELTYDPKLSIIWKQKYSYNKNHCEK